VPGSSRVSCGEAVHATAGAVSVLLGARASRALRLYRRAAWTGATSGASDEGFATYTADYPQVTQRRCVGPHEFRCSRSVCMAPLVGTIVYSSLISVGGSPHSGLWRFEARAPPRVVVPAPTRRADGPSSGTVRLVGGGRVLAQTAR
jgi:hypothetical protein